MCVEHSVIITVVRWYSLSLVQHLHNLRRLHQLYATKTVETFSWTLHFFGAECELQMPLFEHCNDNSLARYVDWHGAIFALILSLLSAAITTTSMINKIILRNWLNFHIFSIKKEGMKRNPLMFSRLKTKNENIW